VHHFSLAFRTFQREQDRSPHLVHDHTLTTQK